jgi:hypothetical protein
MAVVATALTIAVAPVIAQDRPPAQPSPSAQQLEARRQIFAFESVLVSAVAHAADMLIQHSSTTPRPANNTRYDVLLTGEGRARGFRLPGYGAMFDVEFPSIRRSVAFTMRTLERPDPILLERMKELRKNSQALADQQSLQQMDMYIKELEDQIQASKLPAKNVSSAVSQAANPSPAEDPRSFYASQLTNALISAVLDQGATIGVGPDEWLTIEARESLDLRFIPDDPATTLAVSIKGSDLAALRDKRITLEEARKRVDVKQY